MTNLKEWFRRNGRKGGKASAAKLSPEQRSERARKVVNARWARRKLIHWAGTPAGVCQRKDAGTDKTLPIVYQTKSGPGSITYEDYAFHLENVTCKVCRAYAKTQKK